MALKRAKCTRCGEVVLYKEFDDHVCAELPILANLDLDLLEQIINKTLTEADAWKIQTERS